MNHYLHRIIRRAIALALCFLTTAVFVHGAPTAAQLLKIIWVNVPQNPPEGVRHGTFKSKCMKTTVGYNIYLPPSYDAGSTTRFPVVYFLHGSQGNESRSIQLSAYLDKAIKAGDVPPMLMVFANGGHNSNYIDAVDGTVLPETMIVKELFPHIDATYRTISSREGRAIQGFSMGGGGALRIAAKFPELFSSVVVYGAGGVREFDEMPSAENSRDVEKTKRKMPLRLAMLGDDISYWRESGSWYLLEKNRDRIVDRLPIRIVIGTEDFSLDGAKEVQNRLAQLKIAYQFELIQGPDHNINKLYDHSGLEGLRFHARNFAGNL